MQMTDSDLSPPPTDVALSANLVHIEIVCWIIADPKAYANLSGLQADPILPLAGTWRPVTQG